MGEGKSIEDLLAMQGEWDELMNGAMMLLAFLNREDKTKEEKLKKLRPALKEMIFKSTELTLRCGMDLGAVKEAFFGEEGALKNLASYEPSLHSELDSIFKAAVEANDVKIEV